MLLDLLNQNVLHLHWSNILCALYRSIELLALEIAVGGLIEKADSFEHFGSAFILRDV